MWRTCTSTFKGVTWLEAPTLLRDLDWTPLEGPGRGLMQHVEKTSSDVRPVMFGS